MHACMHATLRPRCCRVIHQVLVSVRTHEAVLSPRHFPLPHRFPASADPAVFAAQKTLVEAWSIVEDAYVDGRFGGHDWEAELSDALVAAYAAKTGDTAYAQIGTMLDKLGDPFTRIVPASCALTPPSLPCVHWLYGACEMPSMIATSQCQRSSAACWDVWRCINLAWVPQRLPERLDEQRQERSAHVTRPVTGGGCGARIVRARGTPKQPVPQRAPRICSQRRGRREL